MWRASSQPYHCLDPLPALPCHRQAGSRVAHETARAMVADMPHADNNASVWIGSHTEPKDTRALGISHEPPGPTKVSPSYTSRK